MPSPVPARDDAKLVGLSALLVLGGDAAGVALIRSEAGARSRITLALGVLCALAAVLRGLRKDARKAQRSRGASAKGRIRWRWAGVAIAALGGTLSVVSNVGGSYDTVTRFGRFIDGRHPVNAAVKERQRMHGKVASLRPEAPRSALLAILGQPVATGRSSAGLLQDLWVLTVGGHTAAVVLARSAPDGTARLLAISAVRRDFNPPLPSVWWGPSGTPLVMGKSKLAAVGAQRTLTYANRYVDDYGWLYEVRGPGRAYGDRYAMWGVQDWDCAGDIPILKLSSSLSRVIDEAGRSDLPDKRVVTGSSIAVSTAERARALSELAAFRRSEPVFSVGATAASVAWLRYLYA